MPYAKYNEHENVFNTSVDNKLVSNTSIFSSTQCLVNVSPTNNANGTANGKKEESSLLKNRSYNEFLSLFVEIIPKFEKRKEFLIEHCVFVKNMLEMAFHLLVKSSNVSYSYNQELVETQFPLPIKFFPKTKFWGKISAMTSNDKNKEAYKRTSY